MRPRQLLCFLLIANFLSRTQTYRIRNPDKALHRRMMSNVYSDMSNGDDGGIQEDAAGSNQGGNDHGCEEKPCGGDAVGSILSQGNPKQKASNIALKAAQEAKAASDAQAQAAEAAAHQVKVELADKAIQSARAAEAALAGKEQIMEQLQHELQEATLVIADVHTSLQNSQTNANLANQAAVEAQKQMQELKRLVQDIGNNMNNIENVANGAQQELSEKTQLLEAAKVRVEGLQQQLTIARQDFEKTKQAAYKAACAAVEAKQKATRSRRMLRHQQSFAYQQSVHPNII